MLCSLLPGPKSGIWRRLRRRASGAARMALGCASSHWGKHATLHRRRWRRWWRRRSPPRLGCSAGILQLTWEDEESLAWMKESRGGGEEPTNHRHRKKEGRGYGRWTNLQAQLWPRKIMVTFLLTTWLKRITCFCFVFCLILAGGR